MGSLASDLSNLLENFSLLEEENENLIIQEEDLIESVSRGQLCLVGKLLADRVVSKETIKSTLLRGWRLTGTCSFKVLGENLFVIEFQHNWDNQVFWRADLGYLKGICLRWKTLTDFYNLPNCFRQGFFWVRMYNLPLACMNSAVGYRIGSSVGQVEEVDLVEDVAWGEFLRVRILLDLSKPLSRGRMLKIKSTSVWVAFQYEKLPNFCYHCGLLRHGYKGCLKKDGRRASGEDGVSQYGAWLKAIPSKRYWDGRGGAGGRASMNRTDPAGREFAGAVGQRVEGGHDKVAAGERGPANSGSAVENWNVKGGSRLVTAASSPVTPGEGIKTPPSPLGTLQSSDGVNCGGMRLAVTSPAVTMEEEEE
ncbi:hypothetical protein SLA2020_438340 [Shorea laevis]